MPNYTYFIISPGHDRNSFVHYESGDNGCYIKYGEQKQLNALNKTQLRTGYETHNPDFGIAAIMDSSVFTTPALGTTLKNYIKTTLGIVPVGKTEWFSIEYAAAWKLFDEMLNKWDEKQLVRGDDRKLQTLIAKHLT